MFMLSYNRVMNTLQEFLIKGAGIEKEAKRALLRALEKGIDIARHKVNYPNAMSTVDLKTPLIKRIANTISGSGGPPITDSEIRSYISTLDRIQKRDLLRRITNDGMSNAMQEHSKRFSTKPYFTSMVRYNSQLGKASKIYKKFLEPKPARNLTYAQQELADILSGKKLMDDLRGLGGLSDNKLVFIPTLTTYESKVPFATTHHVADGPASLAANDLARKAVAADQTIQYINNPNPTKGWRDWRSDKFAVNISGRPWSEYQLKLMRDSKNLSGTPFYETVFNIGAKDYPRPTSIYVPNKKWIRKILGIPDDVQPVHIDDIQSATQGILYKGRKEGSGIRGSLSNHFKNHPLNLRRVQYLTGLNLDRAAHGDLELGSARWFAPAARTSWGYIRKPQEMIRLSGDQISSLRKHTLPEKTVENYSKELQEALDTAQSYDLKEAANSVFLDRKYDRDLTRITTMLQALSSRLNLPKDVIQDILLA